MNKSSGKNRTQLLEHASDQFYDLIVIGGGITGAGIALDACHNGLKTLLLEKADFASGTSSKSTKLIHVGLRYLKQLEIALVKESGLERAVVHQLAPHLVHPEKMLLPIVKKGSFGKLAASIAISVYDFLANVKSVDKKENLSKSKAKITEPLLNEQILKGGVRYSEYRTDDARLTIAVVKKAVELGCDAINYAEVEGFEYTDKGQIAKVNVQDKSNQRSYSFRSTCVVSATGPWVDGIREKDRSLSDRHLFLSKGSHIVVPHASLPLRQAVYFDDFNGRMLFAIPRQQVTYIGTTDLEYHQSLDELYCTPDEANYLLEAVNHVFPSVDLSLSDIESSWAGLRPLIHEKGKGPSELSRKDEIFNSPSGLISIAGGKLTGYRKMAERVMEQVLEIYFSKKYHVTTQELYLTDHPFSSYKEVLSYVNVIESSLPTELKAKQKGAYLVFNYGRNAMGIVSSIDIHKEESLTYEQALMKSELIYTIEHELVLNALDFFARRTGKLYFNISDVKKHSELVLEIMRDTLSWDQTIFEYNKSQLSQAIKLCLVCKEALV
jgi:glycerol-3-phosphate dehydrogenase